MLKNKSNDTYNTIHTYKNCRYMRIRVSALKMVKFHAVVTHVPNTKKTFFAFLFHFF